MRPLPVKLVAADDLNLLWIYSTENKQYQLIDIGVGRLIETEKESEITISVIALFYWKKVCEKSKQSEYMPG